MNIQVLRSGMMIRQYARRFHLGVRALNVANSKCCHFAHAASPDDLKDKIHVFLSRPPADPEATRISILDALVACRHELQKLHERDRFAFDPTHSAVQSGLELLLNNEHVCFDENLLKSIFLLKFPSATVIKVVETYYERNPHAHINLLLALIPLRQSLYNAELKDSLRITDITTGHPNYIKHKNTIMRKNMYRLAGTAAGVTLFSKVGTQLAVDAELLLETWRLLWTFNAMILTYLFNSSFFVAAVKFGRQLNAAGGDYLTWQKGTFYTHWYRYCDLMTMFGKIVETDAKLNGGVDNSDWLMDELCRADASLGNGYILAPGVNREGEKIRLLEARENLEELKMQAYWMTGGDGFEWVEPDQDPAEIMWRNHLARLHNPALGSQDKMSLKWAEDLIEKEEKEN